MIASQLVAVPALIPLFVFIEATGSDRSDWRFSAIANLLGLLGCGVAAWFLLRRWRLPVRSLFATDRSLPRQLPWITLGVFAYLMIVTVVFGVLAAYWPWFNGQLQKVKIPVEGPAWFVALFAAVAVPPFEELLFRGVILRGMLARYPVSTALIASAAVFAIPHVDPVKLPVTFASGIALGWLYVQTRSLWLPIVTHALNNGLGVLAASSANAGAPVPIWMAAVMTIAGAAVIWFARSRLIEPAASPDWQLDTNPQPGPAVLGPDPPVVESDGALGDREPQADATGIPAPVLTHPDERLEDLR